MHILDTLTEESGDSSDKLPIDIFAETAFMSQFMLDLAAAMYLFTRENLATQTSAAF